MKTMADIVDESRSKNAVKTNADHIRSMTDEELAKWVDKWCRAADDCDKCPLSDNCPQARMGVTTLDWLKQPYKENTK